MPIEATLFCVEQLRKKLVNESLEVLNLAKVLLAMEQHARAFVEKEGLELLLHLLRSANRDRHGVPNAPIKLAVLETLCILLGHGFAAARFISKDLSQTDVYFIFLDFIKFF